MYDEKCVKKHVFEKSQTKTKANINCSSRSTKQHDCFFEKQLKYNFKEMICDLSIFQLDGFTKHGFDVNGFDRVSFSTEEYQ